MSSAPTDGFVQLPPDGTGKSVATQEITRSDGTTVEIQEVSNYAVINDAPPNNLLPGDLSPLSLTTDGRLRVSTSPATFEVQMIATGEASMWGSYEPTLMSKNSPW